MSVSQSYLISFFQKHQVRQVSVTAPLSSFNKKDQTPQLTK